jgi:hypothetical protein
MLKKALLLTVIFAGALGCGLEAAPTEGEAQIPQDATETSSADDAQFSPADALSMEELQASSAQAQTSSCTLNNTKWVKVGCCANGRQRYQQFGCWTGGQWFPILPGVFKCGTNSCPL